MLKYLHIKDLALIADMELNFVSGINVLTGETGAGKSFILKALNFIIGEHLGTEMIRPEKDQAIVEAHFIRDTNESPLILRRELNRKTGRSRIYINNIQASKEKIKTFRSSLIIQTSQHGQAQLLQPAFQNRLIDDWMNRSDLLERKNHILKVLHEIFDKQKKLLDRFHDLSEQRELFEDYLQEIKQIAPIPGEEEQLEAIRIKLRSTEEIRHHYEQTINILGGADGLLSHLVTFERILRILVRYDHELKNFFEETTTFHQNLEALEDYLRQPPRNNLEVDAEYVESRLFALAQLKRKLHRTLPEIFSFKVKLEENLSFLDACALDIHQLKKEEKKQCEALSALLLTLNAERRRAAMNFTAALEKELFFLGFSENMHVLPDFTQTKIFAHSNSSLLEDRVRLLWAPNLGQPPQPLDRIASGGELSRFLLSIASIMRSRNKGATLIFDEVDAGIGGLTLNRVAERLKILAEQQQIILVTHWPQLAQEAARHFQVSKNVCDGKTFILCRKLNKAEKIKEIHRMYGFKSK